jgi:N-acetylmuramoyl-L-alanine amidase
LLAKVVVESFYRKNVRLLPNSHRSAGFAVLKAPDVPAILIETGFISNPDEAKLLSSRAFQQNIADAMLDGVDAYFRKMQSLQVSQ